MIWQNISNELIVKTGYRMNELIAMKSYRNKLIAKKGYI